MCKFANALKSLGIKKGDRVAIYMPMIPEAAVVMLGCARIGAIHSVVFGGFSADSLSDRELLASDDANCLHQRMSQAARRKKSFRSKPSLMKR